MYSGSERYSSPPLGLMAPPEDEKDAVEPWEIEQLRKQFMPR